MKRVGSIRRGATGFRRLGTRKITLLTAGLFVVFAGIALYFAVPNLPTYRQARSSFVRSDAVLYDRNYRPLHELRVDNSVRRLDWVALDRISPALVQAVQTAEDRRFYEHHGIDWPAVAASLVGLFRGGNARGASTITMQLAARLRPELEPAYGRRSWLQKVGQGLAALALERRWSKEQILEGYLNLVPFRSELVGIDAAARGLFDKEPHGLDTVESLILASLLRSPNAPAEALTTRAAQLGRSLGWDPGLDALVSRVRDSVGHPYVIRPRAQWAPHLARRLLGSGTAGHRVISTVDADLQEFTTITLRHHLATVRDRNVGEGTALVVENATGEVLAYVGNQGIGSTAREVDGIRAMRQAGSTLKPFIYGKAFEGRLLTPQTLLEDSPLDIAVTGGLYRPRNYDNTFHGAVSVRTALGSSLNVPAVRALNLVGIAPVVDLLHQMDFREVRDPDYYGPSLALGSADVTLWDLVGAYRMLANGGTWSRLRMTVSEPAGPSRRVLAPGAADLVSGILSDRDDRSATFSLESPLSTRFWTAVKTGTSKDMRDNWCIGYSHRFTVGVWVGNFSGEPMWDVSGITGAAPVWVEIMNRLHRDDPGLGSQPVTPEGQPVLAEVDNPQRATPVPRIAYPAGRTVVALDPDIPPDLQRLCFEARAGMGLLWVLDGRPLGPALSLHPWAPTRGKHRLDLRDAAENIVDSVEFEVRGQPAP